MFKFSSALRRLNDSVLMRRMNFGFFRTRGLSSASSVLRTRGRRSASLGYQQHEERCLLAGIDFNASTGVVLIGGTEEADRSVVTQSGSTITVTQQGFETRTFAVNTVQSLHFVGLGGDDYFENQTGIRSFAYGQNGNDRLIGGSNDDHLIGNGGDDVITGNGGDDYLLAGNGNDRVTGDGGNDRFLGVRGFNQLDGGDGDDIIFGGIENDIIIGGAGQDLLVGSDGDDQIFGGSEVDQVFGGFGNDTIQGNEGADVIYGQGGNDSIDGGSGNDVLGGNDGNDTFVGAFGNDRIVGGNGTDRSFHSGLFSQYRVESSGPNIRLTDLRGAAFGGVDLEFSIEQFQFFDEVRTPATILNPSVPTTPTPPTSTPTPPISTPTPPISTPTPPTSTPTPPTSTPTPPPTSTPTPPPTSTPTPPPSTPTTPDPTLPADPTPPSASILEVVTIQPIIVANSDGSNQAEFFGNAQQEAEIKALIDEIYAQARIDIEWLPARTWNNTFANVGNSSDRPGRDLNSIVSSGDAAGLGSSNRNVIDLYFVERVPGFGDVSESTANGLAFVGSAGIAMQTGDRLVNFASGREVVAGVAAHEIGHNLGLPHSPEPDNLLASNGSGDLLTQAQINTIIASSLSRPV